MGVCVSSSNASSPAQEHTITGPRTVGGTARRRSSLLLASSPPVDDAGQTRRYGGRKSSRAADGSSSPTATCTNVVVREGTAATAMGVVPPAAATATIEAIEGGSSDRHGGASDHQQAVVAIGIATTNGGAVQDTLLLGAGAVQHSQRTAKEAAAEHQTQLMTAPPVVATVPNSSRSSGGGGTEEQTTAMLSSPAAGSGNPRNAASTRSDPMVPQRRRSSNRWAIGAAAGTGSRFTSVVVRGSLTPNMLFPTDGDCCCSDATDGSGGAAVANVGAVRDNVAIINFRLPAQRSTSADSGGSRGGGGGSPAAAAKPPTPQVPQVPSAATPGDRGVASPLKLKSTGTPDSVASRRGGGEGSPHSSRDGGGGDMCTWLSRAGSANGLLSSAPFSPIAGAAPLGAQHRDRSSSKDLSARQGLPPGGGAATTHSSQLASPQFPSSTFNASGVSLTQRFSFESQSTRTDSSRPSQSTHSSMPPSIASTMLPSGEESGTQLPPRNVRLGVSDLFAPPSRSFDDDGEEGMDSSPAAAAAIPSFVRPR